MKFELSNKEELIDQLNRTYRTILTYEDGKMMPVGEFKVKDIILELSQELTSISALFESSQLVLTKIGDESIEITIPLNIFSRYKEIAKNNAQKLGIDNDFFESIENEGKKAEKKLIDSDDVEILKDVETMSLFENNIMYYINGEKQSSNYSICPVDLGVYKERIRDAQGRERD